MIGKFQKNANISAMEHQIKEFLDETSQKVFVWIWIWIGWTILKYCFWIDCNESDFKSLVLSKALSIKNGNILSLAYWKHQ